MIKYPIKKLQQNNIGYKSYDHKVQWQSILTSSPNNYKKTENVKYYNFGNSNVIPFRHNSLLMVKKPLFFGGTNGV
jgi:hypothetical protein